MKEPGMCEESAKISYADVGRLQTVCPTDESVRALIEHIRSCGPCRHVLAYIRETERTFAARDAEFFEQLKDVAPPSPDTPLPAEGI